MTKFYEIKDLLEKNGLSILIEEREFNGINKVYSIKCSKNHIWNPRLDNIFYKSLYRESKGCPDCAEEIYVQQSLNIAKKHLLIGHTILQSYLKPIKHKKNNHVRIYKIKCDHEHIYEKTTSEISNGCPQCSKTTYVGEERVRLIFEAHFKQPFPTIRPLWLVNPNTNKKLELDGYCEALGIAFEYQGRQHHSNDTEFSGDHVNQSIRDEYKIQACIEHGIKLIVIEQPTSYNIKRFHQSVLKNCLEQGLILNTQIEEIDFSIINDSNTLQKNYNRFKNYVESKNYKLISSHFSTMEDTIDFQCIHEHNFNMKGSIFKTMLNTDKYRNEPCPTCHAILSPKKVQESININTCIDLAKKLNYTCVSTQYVNINTLMKWTCQHGHSFEKSYRQMIRNQTGKYCQICIEQNLSHPASIMKEETLKHEVTKVSKSSSGEARDLIWLLNFVADNKLELLEQQYLGMDIKHEFKCKKKHIFSSTLSNLMDKKERKTSLCNHPDCNGITVIDINTCNKFAEDNNLECISREYKNVNEKMQWKCLAHGHLFEKTYRQFLRAKTKHYCPFCN